MSQVQEAHQNLIVVESGLQEQLEKLILMVIQLALADLLVTHKKEVDSVDPG